MSSLGQRVTVLEGRVDQPSDLRAFVLEQAALRAAGDRDISDLKLEVKTTKDLVKALAVTQSDHGRTLADHSRMLTGLKADVSDLKAGMGVLEGGMTQIVAMLTHLIDRDDR